MFRGVVYPAQCDAMGHMTVQYYTAAFDQAMWGLVYDLGWRADPDRKSRGFADVKHVVSFAHELALGTPFRIDSMVRRIGRSSLVTAHSLIDLETGGIAAEMEMTSVHFDLVKRASTPFSDAFRADVLTLLGTGASEGASAP